MPYRRDIVEEPKPASSEGIVADCLHCTDQLLGALHLLPGPDMASQRVRAEHNFRTARRLVGVAYTAKLKGLDNAAASLVCVSEALLREKSFPWKPIQLHVQAMRLLRHPERLDDKEKRVLAGLDRLRRRVISGFGTDVGCAEELRRTAIGAALVQTKGFLPN